MAIDVTVTARIGRLPRDVFAALVAVERFPEWLIASGIVGVARADADPLAVQRGLGFVEGNDLAIDARLAHAPGDELGDLRAEVDDENGGSHGSI